MAGRFGSNEVKIMTEVLLHRFGIIKQINIKKLIPACEHSGIFQIIKKLWNPSQM